MKFVPTVTSVVACAVMEIPKALRLASATEVKVVFARKLAIDFLSSLGFVNYSGIPMVKAFFRPIVIDQMEAGKTERSLILV